MVSETRSYPVYRSPDGTTEQVAATPAREVQLKYTGWVKVRQPRRKSTTNAPNPKPPKRKTSPST